MAPISPCLPSLLLARRMTGLSARRARSAKARSLRVSPERASITNMSASASPIAVSVCSCIRAVERSLRAFVESRRVDHGETEIAEPGFALAPVAGDAWRVVDQRQLLSDQTVEQRRFPDIGSADNGNRKGHD